MPAPFTAAQLKLREELKAKQAPQDVTIARIMSDPMFIRDTTIAVLADKEDGVYISTYKGHPGFFMRVSITASITQIKDILRVNADGTFNIYSLVDVKQDSYESPSPATAVDYVLPAESCQCQICLEDNSEADSMLLPCLHEFHSECIEKLIKTRLEEQSLRTSHPCPTCRCDFTKDWFDKQFVATAPAATSETAPPAATPAASSSVTQAAAPLTQVTPAPAYVAPIIQAPTEADDAAVAELRTQTTIANIELWHAGEFAGLADTEANSIDRLLFFIVRGKQALAKNMLQAHPELLLERGTATDYSGRTFNNIRPIDYALWSYDHYMLEMMFDAEFDEYHERLREQAADFEALTDPDGLSGHGKHYNTAEVPDALQAYIDACSRGAIIDELVNLWVHGVGRAQMKMPAIGVNEYCQERAFYPCPNFSRDTELTRTMRDQSGGAWFNQALGENFAMFKLGRGTVGGPPQRFRGRGPGGAGHTTEDKSALEAMWEVCKSKCLERVAARPTATSRF